MRHQLTARSPSPKPTARSAGTPGRTAVGRMGPSARTSATANRRDARIRRGTAAPGVSTSSGCGAFHHAGSPGSQKAPKQDPASLVAIGVLAIRANAAPVRCDGSFCGARSLPAVLRPQLALRLFARIALLALTSFFTWASIRNGVGANSLLAVSAAVVTSLPTRRSVIERRPGRETQHRHPQKRAE
jgi:hypothetical protein